MSFHVYSRGECVCFFDVENKIMGKIPTSSNWKVENTDNHIHFGIVGANPKNESMISEITGISIDEFRDERKFQMNAYGDDVTVVTHISSQRHIQLLIQDEGRQCGVKNIIREYMSINNLESLGDRALFFDFSNNIVFIDEVEINNNQAEIPNLNKKRALEEMDAIFKESKHIKDLNEREAYIEREVSTRNSYIQKVYREGLLKEFGSKCAVCGCEIYNAELLHASHIVDYCVCEDNEERIDTNNGLLLCAQHDELFDKKFINFDEEGKIILPETKILPENSYASLKISKETKIDKKFLNDKRISYLKRHKQKK